MTGKRRDVIFLGVALAVVVAIGLWFTVRDDSDGPSADPGPTPTMGTGTPQGSLATQPSTEPSSESSPSASLPSTPSTTPPPSSPSTAPTPMTERSREAAKQAGEDWFKALSWAMTQGDTGPVKTLSASACAVCQSVVQDVERHLTTDVELDSVPFAIRGSQVYKYNGSVALIVVDMEWGQLVTKSKATGRVVFRGDPPAAKVVTTRLEWLANRWQATEFGIGRP